MKTQFASEFNALWEAAGRPTLAAIVQGAKSTSNGKWSVTGPRISEWRRGKHIPGNFDDVAPVLAWLAERAAVDDPRWRARSRGWWEDLWSDARRVQAALPPPLTSVEPYLGLVPFGADHSSMLFGREDTLDELHRLVHGALSAAAEDPAIVIVSGQSGVGKTSLLLAGLAPSLSRVATMTPGDRPAARLHAAVASLREKSQRAETPGPPATDESPSTQEAEPAGLVIVIDQFEECFTLSSAGNRDEFLEDLVSVTQGSCGADTESAELPASDETPASTPVPRIAVVLGVRADLYPDLIRYEAFAQIWQRRSLIVPAMTDRQLRDVIERPAAAAGASLEPGLTDLIISDAQSDSLSPMNDPDAQVSDTRSGISALPLVAYTMRRLWEQRNRRQIMTVAAYLEVGRVTGAVGDLAEQVWGEFDAGQQERARELLLGFVRILPGSRIGKQPQDFPSDPATIAVAERLASARLLVIDQDRVEVGHESLFTAWPRYRSWINAERSAAAHVYEVDVAATAWLGADRPPALLYTRRQLDRVAPTLDSPLAARAPIPEFISASQTRAQRLLLATRAAVVSVIVIALVAVGAAGLALVQNNEITRSRDDAQFASILAAARSAEDNSPTAAAQLAAAAWTMRPESPAAQAAVLRTQHLPLSTSTEGAQTSTIYDIALSDDARLAATASNDQTIGLWRLTPPSPQDGDRDETSTGPALLTTFAAADTFVTSVTIAPERPLLASASGDGSIRLWDISNEESPAAIGSALQAPGAAGTSYITRFHPDRPLLVTTSDNGTVTLWDVADPAQPRVLDTRNDTPRSVRTITFSPDGRWLVAGSDDRALRVYRVAEAGLELAATREAALPDAVHAVAVSADSQFLAGGADDGTVAIWRLEDNAENPTEASLTPLGTPQQQHHQEVWTVAFAPDGSALVSGSTDGTGRVWSVSEEGLEPASDEVLASTTPNTHSAVFLNSSTLMTAGKAGKLTLWNLADVSAPVSAGTTSLAASPATATVVTAGEELLTWRAPRYPFTRPEAVGTTPVPSPARPGTPLRHALSPDGQTLARVTSGTVTTVSPGSAPRSATINNRHSAPAAYLDANRLVTIDDDTSLRLWPTARPTDSDRPIAQWQSPELLFAAAANDATGRVAAAGERGPVYVWDAERPSADPVVLEGHSGQVLDVAFDDRGTLFSIGSDNTLRMWRFDDGGDNDSGDNDSGDTREPTATVLTLPQPMTDLAVAPGGDRLVTASPEEAYLWTMDDGVPVLAGSSPIISSSSNLTAITFADETTLAVISDGKFRWFTMSADVVHERICRVSGPPSPGVWRSATGLDTDPPTMCD